MDNELIPTESSQQYLRASVAIIIVNIKKDKMIIWEGPV